MSLKAKMFNDKAASPKNRPDEILNLLDLKPGQKVADIGSGGGYFTLRFAHAVGEKGTVYAADVNEELLNYVDSNAAKEGLENVNTVRLSGEVALPEKDLDMVFMRNLYHHLNERTEYLRGLGEFLKRNGKLVVIEHKPKTGGFFSFRRLFGHSTPKKTIEEEAKAAGYVLVQDHDVLPEQNFLVFTYVKPHTSKS